MDLDHDSVILYFKLFALTLLLSPFQKECLFFLFDTSLILSFHVVGLRLQD